jgi:hypothetical protein
MPTSTYIMIEIDFRHSFTCKITEYRIYLPSVSRKKGNLRMGYEIPLFTAVLG